MTKRRFKLLKDRRITDITAAEARALCEYDPKTGEFIIRIRNAGAVAKNGYQYVNVGGRNILAHRLAWLLTHGYWPTNTIDHINGNRSDNRLENLREADWSENLCNSKLQQRNISGIKGVTWNKGKNAWAAKIVWRRKEEFLGYFKDLAEAMAARRLAEDRLHGKFARVE